MPPQVSPEEAPAPNSTTPPTKDILTLDSSVESAPIEGKVEAFTLIGTLAGHSSRVTSVAISPDGQIIASGSLDRIIKVWNLYSGQLLRTLTGHSYKIHCIFISPNGRTLVSGGGDLRLNHHGVGTS